MTKKSLTELFYLGLLLSALRPPQNSFPSSSERYNRFTPTDSFGPITAEYLNDDCLNDYFYSSKNTFLLNTRYDLLGELNTLGHYSRPLPHSNVFAFPVSHVDSDDQADESNADGDVSSTATTFNNIVPASLLGSFGNELAELPSNIFEVGSFFPMSFEFQLTN